MTTVKRTASVAVTLLALGCSARASAQTTTTTKIDGPTQTRTTEGLTLRNTFGEMFSGFATGPLGDTIGLLTALEVSTTPTGTSSGGFVFKLDRSTGLQARTATTFGPSFAERALTSGEGKISISANFSTATYSRLGDLSLANMTTSTGSRSHDPIPGYPSGFDPAFTASSHASLILTSKTLVLGGTIGVTDNLDIGVSIPMVTVKLDGLAWTQQDTSSGPLVTNLRKGDGVSSGLGDIGALVKYRLLRFGKDDPDPGGIAVMGVMRLPSGDPDNLRGVGITRTLASVIASSGTGRFRPHANFGYERWSAGLDLQTFDVVNGQIAEVTRTIRDQVHFGAGVELEASPKLTLMVDLLGRNIRGAGQIGFRNFATPNNDPTLPTTYNLPVALSEGVQKLVLVPGLKMNLKGTMLLSINTLISLKDKGLHARFTPVVGLDLTL